MTARIARNLLDRLHAIAAADPGREVCGLLLGRNGDIEAIAVSVNLAADPRVSFEIDPRVQIDAIKAARSGGLPVIGCYHSHPSGDERPSGRDLEMARIGSLWLIVTGEGIGAWYRSATAFEAVPLSEI